MSYLAQRGLVANLFGDEIGWVPSACYNTLMYFESRGQAGMMLAGLLEEKYRYENCAVIALSSGGVLVGEQIAFRLHCVLMMLLTEDIEVPGEGLSFGAVSQDGDFTYNSSFSSGQIEGFTMEFHGYLNEQKRLAFQKINRLIGDGGTMDADLLRDNVLILVSDGLDGGASLDVALDYLKPIRYQKLVVVAPVAAVPAVDKVHIQADEVHILDVKENFFSVDHYYNDNNVPSREEAIDHIRKAIMKWR